VAEILSYNDPDGGSLPTVDGISNENKELEDLGFSPLKVTSS